MWVRQSDKGNPLPNKTDKVRECMREEDGRDLHAPLE